MKADELKEYIETLSKVHASGHSCNKELATAIEWYAVEVGIKDQDERFKEEVKIKAYEEADCIVSEFSFSFWDYVNKQQPLMNPDEVYDAFLKFKRKRARN